MNLGYNDIEMLDDMIKKLKTLKNKAVRNNDTKTTKIYEIVSELREKLIIQDRADKGLSVKDVSGYINNANEPLGRNDKVVFTCYKKGTVSDVFSGNCVDIFQANITDINGVGLVGDENDSLNSLCYWILYDYFDYLERGKLWR